MRRCLIINGSLHPASIEQVRSAVADGLPDGWLIWGNGAAEQPTQSERQAWLSQVHAQVQRAMSGGPLDALIIFGGDAAFAVLEALGRPAILPVGEFEPGVPVSRIQRSGGDLTLITKAGGFGTSDLLCRLRDQLCKGGSE